MFQCYECDSNKHENCTGNKSGEAVFCGPEQIGCLIAKGPFLHSFANALFWMISLHFTKDLVYKPQR